MIPPYVPPAGGRTRWATAENPDARPGAAAKTNHGAKGAAFVPLPAGESLTLLDHAGPGVVTRIWVTVRDRSPAMLRGLRLDAWWDGAAAPAVSAPFGDFFGMGLARCVPFDSEWFASPEGRSFIVHLPMPFKTGARIVLTNESGLPQSHVFYEVDFLALDRPDPAAPYFHAHWRREQANALARDYDFLPRVKGTGRFLGVQFGVKVNKAYRKTWWGEGEVKIRLDGDGEFPTLCGTGLEDYIGTGWGLRGFAQRYQGCPLAEGEEGRYGMYRWHAPDPVLFYEDCRVSIQTLGGGPLLDVRELVDAGVECSPVSCNTEDPNDPFQGWWNDPAYANALHDPARKEGWVNFWRRDDWSSTAYFYLDRPESGLAPLAPAADRLAALDG